MENQAQLAVFRLDVTIKQAPSGGGNIYIDGKKIIGGQGTIKYPVNSGFHLAAFDMTGNKGDIYAIVIAIENGPTIFEAHGTLTQSGTVSGQKAFTL